MSLKQMIYAFNTKVGSPIRKLILLKLADQANDDGECWPSYNTIANACECDRSTVIRHINDLAAERLVEVQHRQKKSGDNHTNIFTLTLPDGALPPPSGSAPPPSGNRPPGPSGSVPPPSGSLPPKPINEPINPITYQGNGDASTSSDVLKTFIEVIQEKLGRDVGWDNTWMTYARNDINRLRRQSISDERLIAALTWYKDNDFWMEIDTSRKLVEQFSNLEKAMKGDDFDDYDALSMLSTPDIT